MPPPPHSLHPPPPPPLSFLCVYVGCSLSDATRPMWRVRLSLLFPLLLPHSSYIVAPLHVISLLHSRLESRIRAAVMSLALSLSLSYPKAPRNSSSTSTSLPSLRFLPSIATLFVTFLFLFTLLSYFLCSLFFPSFSYYFPFFFIFQYAYFSASKNSIHSSCPMFNVRDTKCPICEFYYWLTFFVFIPLNSRPLYSYTCFSICPSADSQDIWLDWIACIHES